MKSTGHARYLSTPQAAKALDVSVSTVKRWVDECLLPAHKTAGGHRKLLRAEVLALARQKGLPSGDRSTVVGPFSGKNWNLDDVAEELLAALLAGDERETAGIIAGAYERGVAVETLADQVIAPTMARLGHEWQSERIDVWQEHRGTQLCSAALFELKSQLEQRAERNRPLAIGGAPEGDPYSLPCLLAQLVLIDAGWEVLNLGSNTPLASLKKALETLRPRLLFLSASFLPDPQAFVAGYRNLYAQAEALGVAVVVGGRALDESLRAGMNFTSHGDCLTHLASLARVLHPRPKKPRKGRPKN